MPCILVADDDPGQLVLRARLLEAAGHEVVLAFSAEEALRQVPSADAIVMDLRLPNSRCEPDAAEGLRLIRRIRESGCGVPVIVVCGWPQDLEGTPEAPFVTRVMVKPVSAAALLQAVGESIPAAS